MNRMLYLTNGHVPSLWAFSQQICCMARGFSRCMDDFTLVTSGRMLIQWPRKPSSELAGVKVVKIPVGFRKVGSDREMARLTRRIYNKAAMALVRWYAPDVVYTRTSAYACSLVRSGFDVAFEIHEPIKNKDHLSVLLAHSSQIKLISLTETLREELSGLGFSSRNIHVEPSGVDLEVNAVLPEDFCDKVGLDGRPLVVYTGHLYDTKGIPLIIEAARRCQEFQFMIAGGWPEDVARFRGLAAEIPNVILTGFMAQAEVFGVQNLADILVLPTSSASRIARYTSPLKLFEYCRAGRAILASDLENIRTVIRHGDNGFLFRPDDIEDFVHFLKVLGRSSDLRETFGCRARLGVERYAWPSRARRIMQFLSANN
jgi:glycosyltransferase involved in cell wall biosynthesis